MNLRELQQHLPWGNAYSPSFLANLQQHRDFTHALLHVAKAIGPLSAEVEAADHDAGFVMQRGIIGKALADIVICAFRMANTAPCGPIDLEAEIVSRLRQKNPGWEPGPEPTGAAESPPRRAELSVYRSKLAAEGHCMAASDGDCDWSGCPQTLDGEPGATGRSCPRWVATRHKLDPDDEGRAGG
jgi:hypothetical protein